MKTSCFNKHNFDGDVMNIGAAIEILDRSIENPLLGLPEEIFLFISRITPIINVDLLIKDENKRTLLSWRDDRYAGKGWHLPGGILRFKESLETRVKKVAENEIGINIMFNPAPIAFNQIINDSDIRGHFISFLYECYLPSTFIPQNKDISEKDKGFLKWHYACPVDIIKVHEIYKIYI
jgi:colanic acid biosynthesis protein WcaH